MNIKVIIDDNYQEPQITIKTSKITEEISNIIKTLENKQLILGIKNETLEILEQKNIIRIYTENQKVIARTTNDIYNLKLKLYELEDILDSKYFVRISKSEIINIKYVKNFDFNILGTIIINFKNNEKSYVSRRYIPKIKKTLGL